MAFQKLVEERVCPNTDPRYHLEDFLEMKGRYESSKSVDKSSSSNNCFDCWKSLLCLNETIDSNFRNTYPIHIRNHNNLHMDNRGTRGCCNCSQCHTLYYQTNDGAIHGFRSSHNSLRTRCLHSLCIHHSSTHHNHLRCRPQCTQ